MSADDVFAQILSSPTASLNPQALLGFDQAVQQNSLYRTAAAPILGARFDTRTWSPGTAAAVTAGQAFLGSILGELASRDEARQLEKVAQVLPQLQNDPMSVLTPSDVDPKAFNQLRMNALLNQSARRQSVEDLATKMKIAAVGEGMKEQSKIAGRNAAYGFTSSEQDPDSPQAKGKKEAQAQLDSLRKEFQNSKSYLDFEIAAKAYPTFLRALADSKNPAADFEITKRAVQMIEPGLATNRGETEAVVQSGAFDKKTKAALLSFLKGESALPADIRQGLVRLAERSYLGHKEAFERGRLGYAQKALEKGIDLKGQPIDVLGDISKIGEGAFLQGFIGTLPKGLDARSFAISAKDAGLSVNEARQAWQQYAGK